MQSTVQASAWDRFRASFGRRGVALLLAFLVEALIALLFLFYLVPQFAPKRPIPKRFGFDIEAGDSAEPEAKAEKKAKSRARGGAEAERQPRIEPPPAPPVVPEAALPANVLWLSRRDYAASDIARTRPSGADAPANEPGPGRSSAGDSELAEGRGPNGEPLYAAEWHVRPTNAQLRTYLPERMRQSGWGLVACRTVANYRVEDCQELGDFPRGSGLAGAVRQAAWQFRVRPPRVGGKALVGAWVRIRIDYTVTQEKSDSSQIERDTLRKR